jgi:Iron only hydrogenase large subunit, C-terminal domain
VLRFAAVYGFRNIQTLVRKIKMKRCEYDYVEVMACPSGGHRAVDSMPSSPWVFPDHWICPVLHGT